MGKWGVKNARNRYKFLNKIYYFVVVILFLVLIVVIGKIVNEPTKVKENIKKEQIIGNLKTEMKYE